MGKNHQSQKRKAGKAAPKQKANNAIAKGRTQAVDVVTGKATVEYFFDPCLLVKAKKTDKVPVSREDPLFFEAKHLFMPCTIIKPLEGEKDPQGQPYPAPALVKTSDGTLHKITDSNSLTPLVSPDDYIGCADVLHLPQITEASLLNAIRTRFQRDEIYTSAGPILISVNPYRDIVADDGNNIYSEEQMLLYRSSATADFYRQTPPHLFLTANRAYNALIESIHSTSQASHLETDDPVLMLEHQVTPGTVRNQSIIISGESGAGKTEATKIIMKFLARITRHKGSQSGAHGKMMDDLEDQVLSSNPLLEAFGNAQTLRNDNSSRFGKFIHIFVSTATGSITGASISNYLLERTRITQQSTGERNYHIFYQLLSGGDPALLAELDLENVGPDGFRYLSDGANTTSVDAAAFQETLHCLTSIGLSADEQQSVFGMVAAVLHLGNLRFEASDDGGDTARISDASRSSLHSACRLLGIEEAKMAEAILTKTLTVDCTLIKKEQNVLMAADKRDALAKLTYSCLFLWLVQRINKTLDAASQGNTSTKEASDEQGYIGVLDIYGFECFGEERNGFEQLLINYCNEKLQRHFNRHLFEVEQQMYADEGVDWSYITFNDNRPCVELLEGGSGLVGILGTLDDAWGTGMGSASEKDAKFVAQLHKKFGQGSGVPGRSSESGSPHANFLTPKIGTDKHFTIRHYAGEVRYTAEGFNDKNMDTLSNELRELGVDATVDLASSVYAYAFQSSSNQRSSIRGVSVGSQFRTSLQSLVDDLEATQPHYIRCILPNRTKAAGSFISGDVLKQLRYSGMMEAIRIRREGYAFREDHESFFSRFSVLLTDKDLDGGDAGIVPLVKTLSKHLHVTGVDWQIGHSKIFLRRELAEKLDRLAKLRVHVAARTLTHFGRRLVRAQVSCFLVTWVKFRLHMIRQKQKHRAASRVASLVRRFRSRQQYIRTRQAIVTIQACQRARLASRRVKKIIDPFYDLTFKECKQLLQEQQKQLEEAVAANEFRRAADLESRIECTKVAVEDKRPLTRSVVDKRIAELQLQLDDAMRRKEFKACGAIQDQLEKLVATREVLPTVAEIRTKIGSIEVEIAKAAKNRDFETAASFQTELAQAQLRLQECLEAEDADITESMIAPDSLGVKDGSNLQLSLEGVQVVVSSRADLEKLLVRGAELITQSVAAKDFKRAAALQSDVDQLASLRASYPTATETRDQLHKLNERMTAAVSSKQFDLAEEINREIAAIKDSRGREASVEDDAVQSIGVRAEFEQAAGTNSKASSVVSVAKSTTTPLGSMEARLPATGKARTVSRLRPAKPLTCSGSASISIVATMLSAKRASSCIILGESGEMVGIITDTDFTRRAVADKSIDLETTPISKIMTPSPTCVALTNAAMDALTTMLENHFRHLPVVDNEGVVVGLLDISKCLRDVIAKLETMDSRGMIAARDTLQQVVQGASEEQALAMHAMLSDLMAKAMGGKAIPTLRSILQGKPSTIISPSTSLRDAGLRMAECKHAALIVEDGRLVGIFGFKDMMSRAIAKQLPLDTTPVSAVMTQEPEHISPDMTVIDALYTMADNTFLTLPVVEDDGRVVGLVDVLDVIYASGGTEGWRSIFSSAMEADDAASVTSVLSKNDTTIHAEMLPVDEGSRHREVKTVAKLRPSKAVLSLTSESILAVAQLLQRKRSDASLVVYPEGALAGIVTDTDFTRRAVAKYLDPGTTPISAIITNDPMCVSIDDPAMEALECMIENRFRHLPVVDSEGAVVGVLDIKKCMNAAIAKLERMGADRQGQAVAGSEDFIKKLGIDDNGNEAQIALLQSLLGSLMTKATGGEALPTLAGILKGKPSTLVGPSTSIRDAGLRMAASRHAALIVENGKLLGIFGFKDMMSRAVANELPLDTTPVSNVMTPEPEFVSPNLTVLEALQTMYDHKILTLPVVDDRGNVVGLVDIMDVLFGCGGAEGWRSIFSSAMDIEETGSKSTAKSQPASQRPETVFACQIPPHIPATLEFEEDKSFAGSTLGDLGKSTNKMMYQPDDLSRSTMNASVFKVTDPAGNTHRIKCPPSLALLLENIAEKANLPLDKIQLEYTDEEGDTVLVSNDDDVAEVYDLARQTGKVIKLFVRQIESSSGPLSRLQHEQLVALAVGGALTFIGILALVLNKPRK